MLLQTAFFPDYNWPIRSLKQLRRMARAIHRRPPTKCTLCNAEMEYNPACGWYIRKDGEIGGCEAQFETGSVHHQLDNGKRSHRFAGFTGTVALKA